MKGRTHIAFLAALLVLGGVSESSWGHRPPGVTYYAFQFPDDHLPVLDGDLSDWDIVPEAYVVKTEDLHDIYSGTGRRGANVDVHDLALRAIVGWNDTTNRLYFMAEVFDDIHRASQDGSIWDGDNWHILLDADHSGGRPYCPVEEVGEEAHKRLNFAQTTLYTLAEPPVQGVDFLGGGYSTWTEERGEFFDVGWSSTGDPFGESTYYYEFFIYPFDDINWMGPEVSKHHDLREGEIIGLEYSFFDYDLVPHTPESCWSTSDWQGDENQSDFYLCSIDPVFAGSGRSEEIAGFSAAVREGEIPLTVQFTAQYTGEITYYVWDFGDGGRSEERNPRHTYKIPGVYTVKLDVMGPDGWYRAEKAEYITVRGRMSELDVRIPRVPAVSGERIRVPVLINDVTDQGVVSLGFSVEYEEKWLEALGVETDGTLLESVSRDDIRYETRPGGIDIEVTTENTLVGEGVLAFLEFEVSSSAEPGSVSRLGLVNVSVNGKWVGWGEEGEVGVTMVGDTDYDHRVTGYDAGLVVLTSVGAIKLPYPDYPNLRVTVGDVDDDGDMDEVDAALMLQYGEGSFSPSLPKVHASVGLGEVERDEEGVLVVPIVVSELGDVMAGRISLTIEGKRKPVGIIPGDGIPGYVFGHSIDLGHWGEGNRVRIAFAGRESSRGPGRIVELHFDPEQSTMGMIRLKEARLNGREARVVRGEIDLSAIPETYRLYPNYPNPFNVGTTVAFDVPKRGRVELSVWDMLGQRVRRLAGGEEFPLGRHEVVWDGRDDSGGDVGSGVYVCRLRVDGFSQVRKMVLMR